MERAKGRSKGQITIQLSIRKLLSIKDGDNVLCVQEGNKVIMTNASMNALLELQESFKGIADELGVKTEQDVVDMVKEIRAERAGGYLYG